MTGIVIATGWLLTATAFLMWLWTNAKLEDPPDTTIIHTGRFAWNYRIELPGAMWGTGYLTRGSAIRAANQELKRLNDKETIHE